VIKGDFIGDRTGHWAYSLRLLSVYCDAVFLEWFTLCCDWPNGKEEGMEFLGHLLCPSEIGRQRHVANARSLVDGYV
jgi:hypothetical protein